MGKAILIREPGCIGGVYFDDVTLAVTDVWFAAPQGTLDATFNGTKLRAVRSADEDRRDVLALLQFVQEIKDERGQVVGHRLGGLLQTGWARR